MRCRGQATVLAVALLAPASTIALLGLALLGARVQGERAQRLADTAALRTAIGLPVASPSDAEITRHAVGGAWRVDVRLHRIRLVLPGISGTAFTARASATAQQVTNGDGGTGAVLVG